MSGTTKIKTVDDRGVLKQIQLAIPTPGDTTATVTNGNVRTIVPLRGESPVAAEETVIQYYEPNSKVWLTAGDKAIRQSEVKDVQNRVRKLVDAAPVGEEITINSNKGIKDYFKDLTNWFTKKQQNGGFMNYSQYLQAGGQFSEEELLAQEELKEREVLELFKLNPEEFLSSLQDEEELLGTVLFLIEKAKKFSDSDAIEKLAPVAEQLGIQTLKCGGKVRAKVKKAACGAKAKKAETGLKIPANKLAKGGKPVCPCMLKREGGKLIEVDSCTGMPIHKDGGTLVTKYLTPADPIEYTGTWSSDKYKYDPNTRKFYIDYFNDDKVGYLEVSWADLSKSGDSGRFMEKLFEAGYTNPADNVYFQKHYVNGGGAKYGWSPNGRFNVGSYSKDKNLTYYYKNGKYSFSNGVGNSFSMLTDAQMWLAASKDPELMKWLETHNKYGYRGAEIDYKDGKALWDPTKMKYVYRLPQQSTEAPQNADAAKEAVVATELRTQQPTTVKEETTTVTEPAVKSDTKPDWMSGSMDDFQTWLKDFQAKAGTKAGNVEDPNSLPERTGRMSGAGTNTQEGKDNFNNWRADFFNNAGKATSTSVDNSASNQPTMTKYGTVGYSAESGRSPLATDWEASYKLGIELDNVVNQKINDYRQGYRNVRRDTRNAYRAGDITLDQRRELNTLARNLRNNAIAGIKSWGQSQQEGYTQALSNIKAQQDLAQSAALSTKQAQQVANATKFSNNISTLFLKNGGITSYKNYLK